MAESTVAYASNEAVAVVPFGVSDNELGVDGQLAAAGSHRDGHVDAPLAYGLPAASGGKTHWQHLAIPA